MDNKFINIDISAVTFTGLSLSYQRKIALVASLAVWFGLAYLFVVTANTMKVNIDAGEVVLAIISATLLSYIFGKSFFITRLTKWLVKCTPLGTLYRHDKRVLNEAKTECLSISSRVKLIDYLEYSKINPTIRSKENLLVMAHQKKGDLHEWIKNARNLKLLANLVYQIHLVEQVIQADRVNDPVF